MSVTVWLLDRDGEPERVAGFWYSLAPNADERLKAYVYKYIKVIGEAPARARNS